MLAVCCLVALQPGLVALQPGRKSVCPTVGQLGAMRQLCDASNRAAEIEALTAITSLIKHMTSNINIMYTYETACLLRA